MRRAATCTGGSSFDPADAANAAVWAVEAGATSRVHGRIGSDVAGALLRDELIARGVEPALAIDRTAATGTMLVVHEPRERSMVADRGAGGRLAPDDLPERLDAGAVLVSGDSLLFEPTSKAGVAASSAPGRGSSRSTRRRGR